MFSCPKCGRKLKTLHERVYGEKPHYEPAGYHCQTCRIFYDGATKQPSKAVYEVAKQKNQLGGLVANEKPLEITVHKAHAVAAQNACESEQERMRSFSPPVATHAVSAENERENTWMGRDLNSRPPVCETGILTSLDHPSSVSSSICYNLLLRKIYLHRKTVRQ